MPRSQKASGNMTRCGRTKPAWSDAASFKPLVHIDVAMKTGNLFAQAGSPVAGERFDELLRHKNLVIERIVSSSALTQTEYVQQQDEWVILVQGEARMVISGAPRCLKAGDYLFLPAGVPHTVESASEGTIWLAVHLYPD